MLHSTEKVLRLIKISLLGTIAVYFTFVVLGNVTDYETNFAFVQHVLSMDTTFQKEALMWRAITSPAAHHAFYWLIIAWEALVMILAWMGFATLLKQLDAKPKEFHKAKAQGLAAIGLGMLLWFLAFMTVGGEWFAMWQSDTWNGLSAAFRMFTVLGITLLAFMHKDE